MLGCSALCCWRLYNQTDTATRITCSALSDTHSFSSTFPRAVTLSSYPSSLASQIFATQLNALLNALFPSVSFHYQLLPPFSMLFLSVSLWLLPKIPGLSLHLPFSLLSALLSISHHLQYLPSPSMSISPPFSVWAPAQILLMLLHAGLGPNQQGNKSIQQENYVMCHHIDWLSLLLQLPWVVSSSTSCSLSLTYLVLFLFVCLLPSFNKINCQSLV